MEKSIAILAIVNFTVMGLSHLLQHQAWKDFFLTLHSHGRTGAFANGFLTLIMGSLIVSFHNVWQGLPVILTLLGWAYVVKSAAIFLNPDWNVRSMGAVQNAPKVKFYAAGLVMLSMAILLAMCIALDRYSPTALS